MVVGGVLGAAFLVIVIVLIYVLRCRRQSLRPTNTYLYNEASGSSTSNLLYTTATSPPAYNSVYVVGAPPPYPGIATPYPISGFTNGAFVPTETAEEGAAANPSSVLRVGFRVVVHVLGRLITHSLALSLRHTRAKNV